MINQNIKKDFNNNIINITYGHYILLMYILKYIKDITI